MSEYSLLLIKNNYIKNLTFKNLIFINNKVCDVYNINEI